MHINRLSNFFLLQIIAIISFQSLGKVFLGQTPSSLVSSHILSSSAPSHIILHQLHFDSCTFFTQVNLPSASQDGGSDQQDFVTMALSLNSMTSFLVSPSAEGCENFLPYNCKNGSQCVYTDTRGTLDLPFLQVEGNLASSGMYFDDKNLNNSQVELLYVDKCTNNHVETVPPVSSGIIGLGISGNNKKQFSFQSSFSIFIHQNGKEGELIFGLDSSKVGDYGGAKSFETTSNWDIQTHTILSLQHNNSITSLTTNFAGAITFDMNACFIGFPGDLLNNTITNLSQKGLVCETNQTAPPYKCTFQGEQKDLPSIFLSSSGDFEDINAIIIDSKAYLNKTEDGTYTLMIVPLDDVKLGNTFLANEKYRKNIILGIPFLKHHYVYFESEKNDSHIILYKAQTQGLAKSNEGDEDSGPTLYIFIIIGVAVILFSVWLFGCCKRIGKKKKKYHSRPEIQPLTEEPVQFLEVSRPGRVVRPSIFKKESEAKSSVY